MKKLIKILEKENKKTTLRDNECQRFYNAYKLKARQYNLSIAYKDDFDYFYIQMMDQAIKNKELFEKTYEEIRNQKLIELWDTIDYNQRNFMMNQELDKVKENMPHFKKENKMIWIPFFDELINSLYDKQMVVFELPQFFKLYKKFHDKVVNRYYYGYLPFESKFIEGEFLVKSAEGFGFYYEKTHSLYIVYSDETTERLPLSLKLKNEEDHRINRIALVESILNKDVKATLELLVLSDEISDKSKKKLQKFLNKKLD